MDTHQRKKQMVIGHRGASSLAPENTMAAFRLAHEHQLPWIEVDADILADGTVVICHDDTLERCSDAQGYLLDLMQSDLNHIDAGSWFSDDFIGERIPTLVELIHFTNKTGMNLNLEIKSGKNRQVTEQLINGVLQDLKTHWHGAQSLLISSFNHLLLAEINKRAPDIKLACLFESPLPSDWLTSLEYVGASVIHPNHDGLTKLQVESMVNAGYQVNVWTVNNLARSNELFNWGVTGICSDIAHLFPARYRN